jgi:hypothetical protein
MTLVGITKMFSTYRDIEVSKELRQCGVTKLGKENTKISVEYHFQAHDGQDVVRIVIFNLRPEGFLATMEEYDKQARGGWGRNRRIPLPSETIELPLLPREQTSKTAL